MKMLNLNDREWKEFYLRDIFPEIQRGKRLKTADHVVGNIPYVSSSSVNNGVDAFIGNTSKIRKFSDCLSLANSGSVGKTFYHNYEFIASDHVTALKSDELSKYSYIFIATIVQRLEEKYSFNREINDMRINKEKILLPVNEQRTPDYAFMEQYIKEREKQIIQKYISYIGENAEKSGGGISRLNDKKWKEFYIEDIFVIHAGKRLTKSNMKKGRKPFIGASDSNNGVTAFVKNTNASEDKNVLGVNYNGSVVENFYHPYICIFSDDVKRFSLKGRTGNREIYLFLKTVILQQQVKYAYGYKFNEERMRKQKVLLPIDEKENPDWNFMEEYSNTIIRNLRIKYLEKKAMGI